MCSIHPISRRMTDKIPPNLQHKSSTVQYNKSRLICLLSTVWFKIDGAFDLSTYQQSIAFKLDLSTYGGLPHDQYYY